MIGRICMKIAGRDSGKICVIIDTVDDSYVMIDGETRRKRCNLAHLEPLDKTIEIGKNASHEEVVKAFKEMKIEIKETKPKSAAPKPKRKRVMPRKKEEKKAKPVKAEKPKAAKSEKPAKVEKPKVEKKVEPKTEEKAEKSAE